MAHRTGLAAEAQKRKRWSRDTALAGWMGGPRVVDREGPADPFPLFSNGDDRVSPTPSLYRRRIRADGLRFDRLRLPEPSAGQQGFASG